MARRKAAPGMVRPTRKRRLIELGKDLLIAALTCSALFLALQTPMAAHLRGWVAPPAQTSPPSSRQSDEAVTPYAIAVRNDLGLYGVSYDGALTSRTFERLSHYLETALSSAGEAQSVSRSRWQLLLEKPGFYCAFQGSVPLSALAHWLGGSCPLQGSVQALVLSSDGSRMVLGWREGGSYYLAETQSSYDQALMETLDSFSPNGSAFAYSLASGDGAYRSLDPYVLISPLSSPQPKVCAAASPDLMGDPDALGQLLTALGFLAGPETAYEVAGGLAVTDNGDRLQVGAGGEVSFRAGEEARYPVSLTREPATAGEAALGAWNILIRAAEPWRGQETFALTEVSPTDTGWVVTFQSRMEGIPVRLGRNGWCARFVVEGGRISEFTLFLRTYSATGESTVLPTARLAAAALNSLPQSDGQLTLCYSDSRGSSLTAGWMTGE